MKIIQTERLILTNFKTTDLPAFVDLINDYQKFEYSKYDHKWPAATEELSNVLKWFSSKDDFLSVKLIGDEKVIGFVSLVKDTVENSKVYNLGYIFNSEYHGCGYAFEACDGYLNFAIRELKAEQFKTGTAKENTKSCKLLAKLGFQIIKEEKRHFQETEKGDPIEFVGVEYIKYLDE
jgi:[ribosomal protein S5]-alanine N-acetyltransferase